MSPKIFLGTLVVGLLTILIFSVVGSLLNQNWITKLGLFVVIFEVVIATALSMPSGWPCGLGHLDGVESDSDL